MKIEEKYHIWNYFFIFLFIVILGVFTLYLSQRAVIRPPGLVVLILLALATYRATRLITKDKILNQFREKVKKKGEHNSFFYTINELLVCSWCVSVWVGLILTMLYYTTQLSIPLLVILSISAVASILQVIMKRF